MVLLLLLIFFPMVQLRLKMKLSAKSSKWTVINSSFFMRAPKWRKNLWQTSLWSCQFYMMMCLEWHLRSFLPFSFIRCLFDCISLNTHIENNVHFIKYVCFLFFVFIVSVVISIFVFYFSFCVYLFSVSI